MKFAMLDHDNEKINYYGSAVERDEAVKEANRDEDMLKAEPVKANEVATWEQWGYMEQWVIDNGEVYTKKMF